MAKVHSVVHRDFGRFGSLFQIFGGRFMPGCAILGSSMVKLSDRALGCQDALHLHFYPFQNQHAFDDPQGHALKLNERQ